MERSGDEWKGEYTMPDYTITLSRTYGSNGRDIAHILSEKLGISYYDRDLLKLASEDSGLDIELFKKADEVASPTLFKRKNPQVGAIGPLHEHHSDYASSDNLMGLQAETIKYLARRENCIIVGRCADFILREFKNVVRIHIYASPEVSAQRVAARTGVSLEKAAAEVEKTNKLREEHYRYNTFKDWKNWNDSTNYDLCINSSKLTSEQCANIILEYMKTVGYVR